MKNIVPKSKMMFTVKEILDPNIVYTCVKFYDLDVNEINENYIIINLMMGKGVMMIPRIDYESKIYIKIKQYRQPFAANYFFAIWANEIQII